jgi:hypothetical protein
LVYTAYHFFSSIIILGVRGMVNFFACPIRAIKYPVDNFK